MGTARPMRRCEQIGDGAADEGGMCSLLQSAGDAHGAGGLPLPLQILQCRCLPISDAALIAMDASRLLRLDLGRCDQVVIQCGPSYN
jgi:hypothetical protein